MSLSNPNTVVTEERLSEFYQAILPYLGGMPDAICNKFDKANLYSTTEKVVGCWIDGRPLYQKTIDFGSLPNGTSSTKTKRVAHGISNLKFVRLVEGTMQGSNFGSLPFVSRGDSTNVNVQVTADTTHVEVTTLVDLSSFNGYITLQYTKTTDAANSFRYADENDYSTDERIVGTWINGKPLYSRVVKASFPSSSEITHTGDFVFKNTSIGTPGEYDRGFLKILTNHNVCWVGEGKTLGSRISFSATNARISVGTNVIDFGDLEIDVQIFYTKTTD